MQCEIVLIWFVVIAAAPPSTESPSEAVRGTVNQALSILEDPALKGYFYVVGCLGSCRLRVRKTGRGASEYRQ
jgi:hypothetical protein